MTLFKYFSFDQGDLKLDSFRNNYLWFSKPDFLNDPEDCNIKYIRDSADIINKKDPKTCDTIISNFNQLGICCFTQRNDNPHMWNTYADNHRGICIEYDTTNFDDHFSSLLRSKCRLRPVDYRESKIDLTKNITLEQYSDDGGSFSVPLSNIMQDPRNFDSLLENLSLQKSIIQWSAEEELRLILTPLAKKNKLVSVEELDRGYKVPIKREYITGVYLGLHTEQSIKQEIINIFGEHIIH